MLHRYVGQGHDRGCCAGTKEGEVNPTAGLKGEQKLHRRRRELPKKDWVLEAGGEARGKGHRR